MADLVLLRGDSQPQVVCGMHQARGNISEGKELDPSRLEHLRAQFGDASTPPPKQKQLLPLSPSDELGQMSRFPLPPPVRPHATSGPPGSADIPPLQIKGSPLPPEVAVDPNVDKMDAEIVSRYVLERRLGQGGYAVVWRATDSMTIANGRQVVIKKILDAFTNDTDAQRVFREIMYQRACNHPSILKLLALWRADNNRDIYMILPSMETDLNLVLRNGWITKPLQRQYILYQLLCALKYLHCGGLVHRDIKPMNVLLNPDCELKLCDFGLIRSMGSSDTKNDLNKATDQVGSRWYRAPEIMLGSTHYDRAVDMWSVGCVLAELMTSRVLLPGSSNSNQLQRMFEVTGLPTPADLAAINSPEAEEILDMVPRGVAQKSLSKLVPRTPEPALNLIQQLLRLNPTSRCDIAAALSHAYLSSFVQNDERRRLFAEESSGSRDSATDSSSRFRNPIQDSVRYPSSVYREYLYAHIVQNKIKMTPVAIAPAVPSLKIGDISQTQEVATEGHDFDSDAMAA